MQTPLIREAPVVRRSLSIVDRAKDVIITGGQNVSAAQVERVIM
jgi:acyl-CoA synthetase (AMP-forming)/AMP-acid ligase II